MTLFRFLGTEIISLDMGTLDYKLRFWLGCSCQMWSRFSEFKMAAGGHFQNCDIRNFVIFCSKMMCNTPKTDGINLRSPFLSSFLKSNDYIMLKFKMAADDNYGNMYF